MALEFIKLVKGDSPVAQVGSLGFFKLGVESGGGSGGGDLVFSRTFSENTPEQISAVSAVISANNMTSAQVEETFGWKIGDTIDITLTTGEAIQMRIIGFNHDDKSDGSGKAGITLDMVNCLNTKYQMNGQDVSNAGGWRDTPFRNTTLPTIKATLPTEWQNVIAKVDKKSANGGSTNFTEVVTTSDDLFLLSEIEIFNTITNAQNGVDEGSVYEYWNGKNPTDRIKNYDDNADGISDIVTIWWLRSVRADRTTHSCVVRIDGTSGTAYVHNFQGTSFAFCV